LRIDCHTSEVAANRAEAAAGGVSARAANIATVLNAAKERITKPNDMEFPVNPRRDKLADIPRGTPA
jgi:hypothetical protein